MNCLLCNKLILIPFRTQKYCGNWRYKTSCGYKNRLIRARKNEQKFRDLGGKRPKKHNPITSRKHGLKRDFGLSLEDYSYILKGQKGVCAICWKKETSKHTHYLSVDHNHKTGKIRGLLCSRCNKGIGFFKDNKELLMNAIKYLNN